MRCSPKKPSRSASADRPHTSTIRMLAAHRCADFGMEGQVVLLLVLDGTFHAWGLLLSLETLRFVLSSFPFQRAACVQFVYSPPSPTRGYFSITAIIREAPQRFQAQVKWLSSLRLPGRQSGASLSNEKGVHGYPHAA